MASVDLLRKLIREEVRAVFQEELAGILKEAIMTTGNKSVISEVSKPKGVSPPLTLNTRPMKPVAAPNLGVGNPLTSLLAETAQSMLTEGVNGFDFTSEDAQGFGAMNLQPQREVQVDDSVNGMLATARMSSNFDAVEINAVPDYTNLMNSLKDRGVL